MSNSRQSSARSRRTSAAEKGATAAAVAGAGSGNVHFSSRTDEWPTPQGLFDELDREFGFTLDPCSTDQNAKCRRHFTRRENGLVQDWGNEVVFMNPPYGREIGLWMQKAVESARAGATVVCLVPARTDTKWWHTCAMLGQPVFLRGRLKFGDSKNSAPFPSALVIFRPGLAPVQPMDGGRLEFVAGVSLLRITAQSGLSTGGRT